MPSEQIQVHGHIIDSLILPKILDEIMDLGGEFELLDVRIGKLQRDTSSARLRVDAPTPHALHMILKRVSRLGAVPMSVSDAHLEPAPRHGVFPDGFYSTTNLPTDIRYRGTWRPVARIEMDCGVSVSTSGRARCVALANVRKGERIVCGSDGIRVTPLERARQSEVFQFMTSTVSSEKPKMLVIHRLAREMRQIKRQGKKILVVAGPAVVHTGSGPYLEKLIRAGLVDVLFAGNGLATHDIESALYGTSLGVSLTEGIAARDGHDHHMRAINTIRHCGSIKEAVRKRVLTRGVLHACIVKRVPFVLSGSIRDDGPLPDVITDSMKAQEAMRRHIPGVGLALMISSTLHSIATGNMLPATVRTICVDINPAVVTKLSDRGTFQGVGIVSDAEAFLRELARALRL